MAARARVEKEFSWPRAAERVAAVYRQLIDEQRQRDMRLPRRLLPQRSEVIYGAD
jgi:hypothetical protein